MTTPASVKFESELTVTDSTPPWHILRVPKTLVVFVKDVDRRIARALVGVELLKQSAGKFDYHTQHDAMRAVNS